MNFIFFFFFPTNILAQIDKHLNLFHFDLIFFEACRKIESTNISNESNLCNLLYSTITIKRDNVKRNVSHLMLSSNVVSGKQMKAYSFSS